jgi:HK97 family phage portal protein
VGVSFNIAAWLRSLFAQPAAPSSSGAVTSDEDAATAAAAELYVRELAFWTCANLIGSSLARCEIRTFTDNTETRQKEHYLWNVSPNINQSAGEFKAALVARLCLDGEALIISQPTNANAGLGVQLVIADSFDRKEYALYEDVFSDVTVGNFTFDRKFYAHEVLYLKTQQRRMKDVTDGIHGAYSRLITAANRSYYRSRGTRGTLEIDTAQAGNKDYTAFFDDLRQKSFKRFADADSAILPLYRGMKYNDLASKSAENSRDIRAMIDDVSDFTARGFGIPPAMLNGTVQDTSAAVQQYFTFCLDPLAEQLEDEINRKRCGYSVNNGGSSSMWTGTYVVVDTQTVQHVDILNSGTAIDKLISTGCYCVNDIRARLGEPLINEDWAWKHWMTKNYSDIADTSSALGGE